MNLRTTIVMFTLCFCLNAAPLIELMKFGLSHFDSKTYYREFKTNLNNFSKENDFGAYSNGFSTLLDQAKGAGAKIKPKLSLKAIFNYLGRRMKNKMDEVNAAYDYTKHFEKFLGFTLVSNWEKDTINNVDMPEYRVNYETYDDYKNVVFTTPENKHEYVDNDKFLWINHMIWDFVVEEEKKEDENLDGNAIFTNARQKLRNMVIKEHQYNSLQTQDESENNQTPKVKEKPLFDNQNEMDEFFDTYLEKTKQWIENEGFFYLYKFAIEMDKMIEHVMARYNYVQAMGEYLIKNGFLTITPYNGKETKRYNQTMNLSLNQDGEVDYHYNYLDCMKQLEDEAKKMILEEEKRKLLI